MKIAAGRADGFVRNPDAQARAVLLYGADDGLIRERADIVARSVVEDPSDPFRSPSSPPDRLRVIRRCWPTKPPRSR